MEQFHANHSVRHNANDWKQRPGPRDSEVLTREIGAQCPGQNLRARLHQEEKLTSETLGLKVKCKFDPR